MRARHVIVIIAIAIFAVGAKLFLFPSESEAISSYADLDIQQMHKDKQKIPVQDVSDMSLMFDRDVIVETSGWPFFRISAPTRTSASPVTRPQSAGP